MLFDCSSESFSAVHHNTLVQKSRVFDAICQSFVVIPVLPYSPTSTRCGLHSHCGSYLKCIKAETDVPPPFEATANFNQRLPFDRFGNLGSMACKSAAHSIRYDQISSFYGPGAVGGWYLTALACLISLSLHPRKRRRDAITADLIAVLTFPTIAAADLITQVRSYWRGGTTSAQMSASIEATLIVTETFLAIDVILFLLAVGFKCVRRPCLLATVGLFCFSAECYVYFSPFVNPAVGQQLGRLFLINFGNILISVIAVLIICVICALGLVAFFFLVRLYEPWRRPSGRDVEATGREREREVEATRKNWEQDFKDSRSLFALTMITFVFLPITFVASAFPLFSEALVDLPSQFLPWIRTAGLRIAHDLIPRSNTSVKELDQAVALLAGASVLGFALYSTADAYYQAWLSNIRAEAQQEGIELRTLNHNQTPRR